MPVPTHDSVCHFIRVSEWSTELHTPKRASLKRGDISVWHEGRLISLGATLSNLQFGEFEGSGKLTLTVRDYLDIASKVSRRTGHPFQVQVEWRPEDQSVGRDWRQWRDTHAQVEMVGTTEKNFPTEFRKLVIIMADRKNTITPPDIYLSDS